MTPPKGSLEKQTTSSPSKVDASNACLADADRSRKAKGDMRRADSAGGANQNTGTETAEQHVKKAHDYMARLDKHADKKDEDVIKVKLSGKEQDMTVGEFRQRVYRGADAEFTKAINVADANLNEAAPRLKELTSKSNRSEQETAELNAIKDSNAASWKSRVERAGFLANLGIFDKARICLEEIGKEPIVSVLPQDKVQPINEFYVQIAQAQMASASADKQNKPADVAATQPTEAQRASADFVKHFGAFEDAAKANNFELAKKELDAAAQAAQKIDSKNESVFALKHAPAMVEFTRARVEQAMNNHEGAKEILDKVKAQDADFAKADEVKFEDTYKISLDKLSTVNKVKDVGTDMLISLTSMGAGLLAGAAAVETGPGALVVGTGAASLTYSALTARFRPDALSWYTPIIGAFNGLGGAMFAPTKTLAAKGAAYVFGESTLGTLATRGTSNIAAALGTSTVLNVPHGYLTGEYGNWEQFKQKNGGMRIVQDAGLILAGGHMPQLLGRGLSAIPGVTRLATPVVEAVPAGLAKLMPSTVAAITPSAAHIHENSNVQDVLQAKPKTGEEIRQVYQSLPGTEGLFGH